MRIILEGDSGEAGLWIGFAKSRLRVLKQLGLRVISKTISLADGVSIYLNSCNGADEIRITSLAGGPGLYICGQVKQDTLLWAWLLERRDLYGKLSWQKIVNESSHTDYTNSANGIAIDSQNGDLYVCGNVHVEIPGYRYWKVEKRSSSGALIWESDVDLKGEAYGISVTEDAVYIAGHSQYIPGGAPPLWDYRIEKRSKEDGTLLWQQTISVVVPPHVDSEAYAVDATVDYVYICGHVVGTPYVECRNASDGSVVWTKQLTTDGGTAVTGGWYNAIKFVDDALYLAGTRKFAVPNIYNWKIEQRETAAGAIVWTQTYSDDGLPEAAHHTQAMDLAVDGEYIFACGYDGGNNPQWRVEKRDIADGALVWEARPDWTLGYPYASEPQAIVARKGFSYAGGYKSQAVVLNTQFYIESYKADGTFSRKVNMTKYPLYSQISDMAIGVK